MTRSSCAVVILAILAGWPTGARAAIVALPGQGDVGIVSRAGASGFSVGEPLGSSQPESGQLLYNGGPVMTGQVQVYTIYWAPSNGMVSFPSGFQAGVNRYVADVAADDGKTINTFSVLPQYYQVNGGVTTHVAYDEAFAGTFDDTDPITGTRAQCPVPSDGVDCIVASTESQELLSFIDARGLPENLSTLYEVFLPPGLVVCSDEGGSYCGGTAGPDGAFCGDHGSLADSGTGDTVIDTLTTWDHLSGCENTSEPTDPAVDDAVTEIAHEWSEAITDPEPGTDRAWIDGFGNEIADLCNSDEADQLGFTGLGAFNQWIDGDPWEVQAMWDNAGNSCRERQTAAPKAAFSIVEPDPYPNQPVAVDGSASSTYDDHVVFYSWSFGDGVNAQGPTPPAQIYTSPGSYPITLTVTDDQGDIDQQVQTIKIVSPPAPAPRPAPPSSQPTVPVASLPQTSFSVSPALPRAGVATTFDANGSNDSGAGISSYAWNFGDGTGATTSTPTETHTYAGARSVQATLTVADSAGHQVSTSKRFSVVQSNVFASPGLADPQAIAPFTAEHAVYAAFSATLAGASVTSLGRAQLLATDTGPFEFAIPTADPGVSAMADDPRDSSLLFTESAADRIGAVKHGLVTESQLSGAGAQPAGISPVRYGVQAPHGLGAAGEVFTEFGDGALVFARPDGKTVAAVKLPDRAAGPFGVVQGPDGNVWFTEMRKSRIGRLGPDGQLTEFALPAGSHPSSITIGTDRALWFVEPGSDAIGRVTVQGQITQFPVPTWHAFEVSPGTSSGDSVTTPEQIVAGGDGALWFVEPAAARIGRISTRGQITQTPTADPGSDPAAIARDPSHCGQLWYTEAATGHLIEIHTSCGVSAAPEPLTFTLATHARAALITARLSKRVHVGLIAERLSCPGAAAPDCRRGARVVPGRGIASLSLGTFGAGTRRIEWNGGFGARRLGAGRYLIELRVFSASNHPRIGIPGPSPVELVVAPDGGLSTPGVGHTSRLRLLGAT